MKVRRPSHAELVSASYFSMSAIKTLKQVQDDHMRGDVFECQVQDNDDGWLAA